MISEEEKQFSEMVQKTHIQAYNMGYDTACKHISDALNLIPVKTIDMESVLKVIDIVKRVSKEKQ